MIIDKKQVIVSFLIGTMLGVLGCYLATRGDHENLDPNRSDSTSGLLSTTSVQLIPKSDPYEEDLCLSQKYTANINGEKVSVPIVKTTTDSTKQPGSPGGNVTMETQGVNNGMKAVVSQTIDLTPVLSKLKPTWELGVGYNYVDNKHYGCVSLQRNYKDNKALELTCQIRDKQVKGVMVQHKWLLH